MEPLLKPWSRLIRLPEKSTSILESITIQDYKTMIKEVDEILLEEQPYHLLPDLRQPMLELANEETDIDNIIYYRHKHI